MIQGVEQLDAEIEVLAFGDIEALADREVQIEEPGPRSVPMPELPNSPSAGCP
jgi:hypothetical protein